MSIKSRWAWIDDRVLEVTLGLALLLVGLIGAAFPILGVTGPLSPVDTRDVHLDGVADIPGTTTSGAVTLRGNDTAELVFAAPDLGQRVLLVLPGLTATVLALTILGLLLRMARTFQQGDAFVPQNARRLNGIALAVLLIATLVPLLDTVTTEVLVSGRPVESAIENTYEVSAIWWLVALLIAATAGAFRHGTRLRADTEGLV
ncbi:DUF2975 domain-containing protein [Actinomadura sp. 9N407]|uniref:DUF2975 domain-containing protein n=1 Tax=Actinomadura sp. 9N407 TaxID=3375154 RepID=UPI0037B0414F